MSQEGEMYICLSDCDLKPKVFPSTKLFSHYKRKCTINKYEEWRASITDQESESYKINEEYRCVNKALKDIEDWKVKMIKGFTRILEEELEPTKTFFNSIKQDINDFQGFYNKIQSDELEFIIQDPTAIQNFSKKQEKLKAQLNEVKGYLKNVDDIITQDFGLDERNFFKQPSALQKCVWKMQKLVKRVNPHLQEQHFEIYETHVKNWEFLYTDNKSWDEWWSIIKPWWGYRHCGICQQLQNRIKSQMDELDGTRKAILQIQYETLLGTNNQQEENSIKQSETLQEITSMSQDQSQEMLKTTDMEEIGENPPQNQIKAEKVDEKQQDLKENPQEIDQNQQELQKQIQLQ